MKSRALVLGLATAIILTGCSAAAEPAPAASTASAENTSTSTPTPTASPEASTEPASLEMTTEALHILAADGTELASFSYFEHLDDSVIDALASAIGADPTIVEDGVRTYEWDGASIITFSTASDTEYEDWVFNARAATVGALSVATDSGISVGSSRDSAEAAGAILDETGTEIYYRLGVTEVDRLGNLLPFCLYLGASDTAITSIGGPAHENRG